MAIIPWLERTVHGDGNVARDMRNLGTQGAAGYARGVAIGDEGLAGVRRDAAGYEGTLGSGRSVLSAGTQSVLRRARGTITDRNTRDIAATASRLAQARKAGRGRLSAEAAQEYMTEAESESNRSAFESDLTLAAQEADLEMTETNTLRDRLAQAREMILGEGRFRMGLGSQQEQAALQLRHERHKAIAQTISSFF